MMTVKKAEARIPDGITADEWAQASLTDRIIYAAGGLHEIIIDKAFKSNDVAVGLIASIYDTLDAIRAASPVQPVLEWRESTLFFNGAKIGAVKIATAFDWTCTDGPPWAYAGIWSKMYTQIDTEDQGRAMLENEARQWLSGGGK